MTNRKSILVTRPFGQADSLINGLSAIGCLVSYQPMLEIQRIESLYFSGSIPGSQLAHFQHIIFVSSNAVRFGLSQILSSHSFINKNTNFYAVGSATAKLLWEAGIEAISPKDKMTSEGLLELASFSKVSGENVALIKGEGGRDYLAKVLQEWGAKVTSFDCYRRVAPKISPITLIKLVEDNNIAMAIFSSGEGVLNFLSLIGEKQEIFSDLTLLVASHRIAKIARNAGWKNNLLVADNAEDNSFVKAVVEWWRCCGE